VAANRLDATVLSPPYTGEASRAGMNILANIADIKASFSMTTIAVHRQFLDRRRDVVKTFVRAYSESIHVFAKRKDASIAVLSKRLKQQSGKVLEETYDYFAPKFSVPPWTDRGGIKNTLQMLSDRMPEVKPDMDVEPFLDDTIVQELENEGFFTSLRKK
jgi:ABC-type nitrate/sulfonate/bicarbonate transport system substrate-binding protein